MIRMWMSLRADEEASGPAACQISCWEILWEEGVNSVGPALWMNSASTKAP